MLSAITAEGSHAISHFNGIYHVFSMFSPALMKINVNRTKSGSREKAMSIWKLPFINWILVESRTAEIEMECQLDVSTYTMCIVWVSFCAPRTEAVPDCWQYNAAVCTTLFLNSPHISATLRYTLSSEYNQSWISIKRNANKKFSS